MTDFNTPETGQPTQAAAEKELIARGLLFAMLAIVGGIALTIVIWRLGFIASITSFAMAAGAIYLYATGAKSAPRKGLIPLVLLIVVGVVVSFFGVVASDAWDAYSEFDALGYVGDSRMTFIKNVTFDGEVLGEYGKDMAMFGVFAVLGVFGTLRRLFQS